MGNNDSIDLADAFADFPGGIINFLFDDKLTLEYFTDGLLGVLSCTREEFLIGYNNSLRNIIYKEDFDKVYNMLVETIDREGKCEMECRVRTLRGKVKWVSLKARISGHDHSGLRIVGSIIDISEYKTKQEEAILEKDKYRQIINLNSNIYFEYDFDSDSIVFNNSNNLMKLEGQKIFNFRQRLSCSTKVHPDDISEMLNVNNYVNGKNVEFRFVSVDGSTVWCCIRAVAILDDKKNIKEIVGCIDNIDKVKKEQWELTKKRRQDSLTQLYNRSHTQKEIIDYLETEGKDSNHAFMIVDIDNFQEINDSQGLLFGDAILISIADSLKNLFYESDIVGRIGGDEFLIFIKDTDNIRVLIDKTEDIREIVKNTYIGEDVNKNISCSIGITVYPEDGKNFEELFRNADMALHKAKLLGKNRYEFYSKELIEKLDNAGKFFNDYKMEPSARKGSNSFDREITTFAFDIMSRTKDVDSAINLILDKIGRQFDATYVSVYEIDEENDVARATYNWTKDGTQRKKQENIETVIPFKDEYKAQFYDSEIYCVNDIHNFSEKEVIDAIKHKGVKAFMQSAIYENGVIEGFVSVVDSRKTREWTRYEIDSLLTVTKVIASYLLKMRASQKMEERLDTLKNYDILTGLPTLVRFKQEVQSVLSENPGKKYVIVSSDFKKFKYINDTLGYDTGDDLLREFANFIIQDDIMNICACRVSSDNFVMLFEENDEDRMVQRMLAVSETFSNRVRKKFFNMNLIISSGVCKIENPNDDIMVIIDNANIAKKQAKEKNKSSCDFFGEKLREKMRIEFEVTNTMEKALAHNEFKVYFQPKVELATGKLVGAEALVRWIKPDGSIMPPDKFIPLFEKNGFVVNLDFFVYEEVCKMFRVWLDSGINVVPISVNVSRVHLYDASFVEEFTGMIDSYNVPHELIELELTESIFLDNTEVALKTMKDFREYGFKVSIDDFGAGYSSLNLLKNMTSDVLKLDKEFFGRGELQKEEEIILTSIVNMAKQLNMKVLSEGVETLAQSKFLKEIACDMAQGYLFAKPMPKESFELIMANDMQFNI